MRHFIKTILVFSVVLAALIAVTFVIRVQITRNIDWEFPRSTHVIFAGASHISKGMDQSAYPGSHNLGMGSERYLFTYLKLKQVLAANAQIDTVYLEFAPTDMQQNTDAKYYTTNEMSFFLPLYFPYFTTEEWLLYANIDVVNAGTILLQKIAKDVPADIASFGRFKPSDQEFDSNTDKYNVTDWLEKGHEVNYRYLDKIIELCNMEEVALILLYMPVFKPEEFFDHAYFYNAYDSLYSEVKFLDYSKLDIPENYRSDEHHLNKTGAKYFTERLYEDMRTK